MEGSHYPPGPQQGQPGGPGGAPPPGYGYGPPPHWGPGPWMARRRLQHPTETKPFFLTSEFAGTLVAIIALAITAAADNSIDSRFFWLLTTIMVAAYVLSRGIAKSGSKSRAWDPRDDMLHRGSGETQQHE